MGISILDDNQNIEKDKKHILNKTELDEVDTAFDTNALRVLAARYLLRNDKNEIIESPKQMFERIAILVTIPDILHDKRVFDRKGTQVDHDTPIFPRITIGKYELNQYHIDALCRLYTELDSEYKMKISSTELFNMILRGEFDSYEARIKEYYDLMVSRDFLPNTPTLMNAGAQLQQLSACFVLPMEDDLSKIMDTSKDAALIFKSGGGVGINYSNLRSEGSMVASTSGVASGPLSFMKIIDAVTEVVKQGGKRRGANMAILNANHPDIYEFITAKQTPGAYENFNVSVGLDEDFWLVFNNKGMYLLTDPHTRKERGAFPAKHLLNLIAESAWKCAEPGVIFFDQINKHNPMQKEWGPCKSTNPCGEQALYPFESCNLGSINLANFIIKYPGINENEPIIGFDVARFIRCVQLCTRFLDNVIDVNQYPISQINEYTKQTRRIGLGIMGLADLLYKIGVQYNSQDGYSLMDRVAEDLAYWTLRQSVELAKERGRFPSYDKSSYPDGELPIPIPDKNDFAINDWDELLWQIQEYGIRNAWTTTIAPTGTLSMIAGCSNGVEPMFSLSYEKRVSVGRFFYTNDLFKQFLHEKGLYTDELLERIVNNYGSIRGLPEFTQEEQNRWTTTFDIHWADHVYAQARWQRWISNAIAKTINLPNDATIKDVESAYLLAHNLNCKGVTVYRDGSRHEQVLHVHSSDKTTTKFKVEPSEPVKKLIVGGEIKQE